VTVEREQNRSLRNGLLEIDNYAAGPCTSAQRRSCDVVLGVEIRPRKKHRNEK